MKGSQAFGYSKGEHILGIVHSDSNVGHHWIRFVLQWLRTFLTILPLSKSHLFYQKSCESGNLLKKLLVMVSTFDSRLFAALM